METEYVIFQQELKKNIKKECHMISYDVREISTQMIKSTFYRKKLEVVETIYGNSNSLKKKQNSSWNNTCSIGNSFIVPIFRYLPTRF